MDTVQLTVFALQLIFVLAHEYHIRAEPTTEIKFSNPDDNHRSEQSYGNFMDIYVLQEGPLVLEFGHVCEDANNWQLRYEKKDDDTNRHRGQVVWGNKGGGYGEHYWDYNH